MTCICTLSPEVYIWALMWWIWFFFWWSQGWWTKESLFQVWLATWCKQLSSCKRCAARTDSWAELHCCFKLKVNIWSLKHNKQHQNKPWSFQLWVTPVGEVTTPCINSGNTWKYLMQINLMSSAFLLVWSWYLECSECSDCLVSWFIPLSIEGVSCLNLYLQYLQKKGFSLFFPLFSSIT